MISFLLLILEFFSLFFLVVLDVLCLVTQSCPTLCNPMDVTHQAPLFMGILQAGILEWVAMSSSRGSLQHRD